MATSLENAMATFRRYHPAPTIPFLPRPPDPAPRGRAPAAVRLWLLRHGERCDEIDASERRAVERAYEAERGCGAGATTRSRSTPRGVEQARRARRGDARARRPARGRVRLAVPAHDADAPRARERAATARRDGGDADGAAPAALPPIVAVDADRSARARRTRSAAASERLRDSGRFAAWCRRSSRSAAATRAFADPAAAANDAGGATRVGAARPRGGLRARVRGARDAVSRARASDGAARARAPACDRARARQGALPRASARFAAYVSPHRARARASLDGRPLGRRARARAARRGADLIDRDVDLIQAIARGTAAARPLVARHRRAP